MQPLKFWQLSALIFPAYFYGFTISVEFQPCFPAVKNQPCNMTCRVQDLLQAVNFYCNGTSRGACLTGVFCNPSIETEGGNTLHFQIPSLSYASDNCDWTCTYGAATSSVSNPTIFSGLSSSLILTNQTYEDKINLTATAECVYPSNTIVRIQYREEQDASRRYQNLTQQIDVQSFHVPGNCGFDIEKRIIATYEVSRKHSLLGGKRVYLRMEFLQYLSATPSYTNDVGPFTFDKSPNDSEDCSQDIFLYGFLPVFLIVLIASIPINILKIDFLSKQFGEFTWKKVGITAVFCVIAIIIGVCLGLLIKGCDKKLLALGLSLFFGILLVVALIFALIYYHKKCESGSDIQDGDGGEDSCNRSSQNYTGSNTTRTATGRVGSPASTSNVELAANLNRNKTDVPKGDQSALNQKAWQSPLPLPPVASQPPTASTLNLPLSRNNQLGPIAVENEEANSSEKKKKKKKKKKKRIVDEAEDNENES